MSGQDIIKKFWDKECIQPWRGGDFVIPVPEVTVAVLLRLGDVEDFILDWVSVRSRLGVNHRNYSVGSPDTVLGHAH